MLKIGEFSRLSQVTVKTLRYYDETGLLKPSEIDRFTGYRYYSVDQLPRIHRIMALKELGLSLEQIAEMLDTDLPADQLRGILRFQQAQIRQRMQEDQAQLSRVEFRLRLMDMEDRMPTLDVVMKEIPPVRALTLRTRLSLENLGASLGAFQGETERALARHKVRLTAPFFWIHYAEEYQMDFQDVELVLPVDETQTDDMPLESAGVFHLTEVPALSMAATYIQRGVDPQVVGTPQLEDTLPVLQRWIVENGYRLCGTYRTVHHYGPAEHAEYADWITEFQHEVERLDP